MDMCLCLGPCAIYGFRKFRAFGNLGLSGSANTSCQLLASIYFCNTCVYFGVAWDGVASPERRQPQAQGFHFSNSIPCPKGTLPIKGKLTSAAHSSQAGSINSKKSLGTTIRG